VDVVHVGAIENMKINGGVMAQQTRVYYQIWGKQVDDQEVFLLYKFPRNNFDTDEDAQAFCEEMAADLKSKNVTDIEIRKVEE
jgi:hypothetical protein